MAQNKLDNNKKNIEKIIENHNGFIQIIFLSLTFVLGILINQLDIQNEHTIIFELLILISLEIIVINVKDSTSQRKLNRLLYHNDRISSTILINIEDGYNQFQLLLSKVNSDLFISGMACNGVWNYISTIEELLKQGHNIRILISSEKAVEGNARIYYGLSSEEKMEDYINDVFSKINITLNILNTNETIKANYGGNFEVRRTDIPFTISYVGINVYSENNSKKMMKITQYIPGYEKDRFPNITVDSKSNKALYKYYEKTLKKIWDDATPVKLDK